MVLKCKNGEYVARKLSGAAARTGYLRKISKKEHIKR